MVSSKYLTAFSDFRYEAEAAEFVSTDRYVQYLNDYTTHFDLWPHIQLSTEVIKILRAEGGKHVVYYQKKGTDTIEEYECDAVAVCSGLHVVPHLPDIPGIEHVPKVMHSSEFKERKQFGKDTTVMIMGAGETGFDIGYLAVTSPTKRVILCHRDGWLNAAVVSPGGAVSYHPSGEAQSSYRLSPRH
jgi:dimethylaniline monooxygenase (N-oxide forming)